ARSRRPTARTRAGSPLSPRPARRRVGSVLPAALRGRSLPRVRMLRLPERRLDETPRGRWYVVTSSRPATPVGPWGVRPRLHRPDRAHLDVPALEERDLLGPPHRLLFGVAVDQIKAAEGLLRLGERPVHDLTLAGLDANTAAVAVRPEALTVHHLAGRAELLRGGDG